MRVLLELAQRETVWPEAEQQIEQPPLAHHARRPQRRAQLAAAPAATVAPHAHRQVEQRLEVAAHARGPRHERLHVARGVAHRERVENEIVVVALESEAGGQDEVRVARGLVAVEIDGDHVLESLQRSVEARAVGRRQHGVAGEGDERADAVAGRVDLLGECGGGQLTAELGQAAHATAPDAEVTLIAGPTRKADQVGGRSAEHEAALAVEISRDRVERDDQPRGQSAKLLRAGADAAVRHRRRRGGEGARQRADLSRRDAGVARDALGREPSRRCSQLRQSVAEALEVAQVGAVLLENHVQQRKHQKCIRPGTDSEVLVGGRSGFGTARVHHHQLSAARAKLIEPARDTAGRHQAAVRYQRIGPEDEEEAGPIDVRHRQQRLMAEHLQRRQHVRQLIDGSGGEPRARTQGAREKRRGQHRRVGVDGRVAKVDADGAAAMLALYGGDALARLIERCLPGDGSPTFPVAALRLEDPVGIALHVRNRSRLGADVATAERIVGVTADAAR